MRLTNYTLAALLLFLFHVSPVLGASRVVYNFTVWVHQDAEYGIDTTVARRILSLAQGILCKSCFGEQKCPIQFRLDGEVRQFKNTRLPRPIVKSDEAQAFLKTEPARKWARLPRVVEESISRDIYLVDALADGCGTDTTEGTKLCMRGYSNTFKHWSLIDTRSSSRTEQWFRCQATLWLHELGHNLGLGHEDLAGNIMNCVLGENDHGLTKRQCNMHSRWWRVKRNPPRANCDAGGD
jgi:hypothetical protein